MGDEADDGALFVAVGGQRGIDVAVLVHFHLRHAHRLQFSAQHFGQDALSRGRGALVGRLLRALGVNGGVPQKSLQHEPNN